MRRLLSILLLAVLLLPLCTPLLALAGAPGIGDAGLPACCRRNGAHHCAMSAAGRAQLAARTRQWSTPPQRCPFRTLALAPSQFSPFTPATPAAGLFSAVLTHPSGTAQTQSRLRIARERSRHKRGPPSLS